MAGAAERSSPAVAEEEAGGGTDQDKADTPSGCSSTPSSTPTTTPTPELFHPRDPPPDRQYLLEDYTPPAYSSSHDLTHSYSWDSQLSDPSFVAAAVSAFRHAPMSDGWDNIIVGMKVEVENSDAAPIPGVFHTAFWVATVLRISGYKVLLRYEGFGQDGTKDFWLNLCSDKVHPVGWCATKGKPLIPPKTIQAKYSDWKEFLVKRLTGARTLPTNFYKVVWESVSSVFKPGMKLEVVDKMRISQVRVATVVDITGRRLQLAYDDSSGGEEGFWCHEESPLIHPVGWARRVGHQIAATSEYHDRCLMETYLETDTTPDMFPEYPQPPGTFLLGMKLEAVDPLNLATICVATVMKVLRYGYIMIRIDGYENDPSGGDWFCYHASSPMILPPGFSERHNIKLKVPAGYEGDFLWVDYLKKTKSQAAPLSLFLHKDEYKHAFKVGMKVECTDLMDPRLVCVGTISRVVGRLLKVHFDGWEEDYDQWMDCECVDIYPVGWCELVGHRLEGPRMKIPMKKEKKRKANNKKAGRSVKRRGAGHNSLNGDDGGEEGGEEFVSRSPTPTPPVLDMEHAQAPVSLLQHRDDDSKEMSKKEDEEIKEEAMEVDPARVEEKAAAMVEEEAAAAVVKVKPEEEGLEVVPSAAAEEKEDELEDGEPKYIPRLLDAAGNITPRSRDSNLDVLSWSTKNVSQFLETNECSNLTAAFLEKCVDGKRLMCLRKPELMTLVNNKIGPCLKIENLLSLLKQRMNPSQVRLLTSLQQAK